MLARPLRFAVFALVVAAPVAWAGTLGVVSTQPPRHASRVPPTAAITVRFDRALAAGTVTAVNVRAYAEQSGPIAATPELIDGGTALRLRPTRPLAAGETVLVTIASAVEGADGSPLQSGGYSFQFNVAVPAGSAEFTDAGTIDVRTSPGAGTRLYGAQATDLDLDGWLDLATMNEDTADLRVYMNEGDGTVSFGSRLDPPTPIGFGASPNEPGDFDADGFPDVAVVNGAEATVSVVLGDGDGTFGPEQSIGVGSSPHGVAALDADGDADVDLVVANYASSDLRMLTNDGSGVFTVTDTFQAGSCGEWTVTAADADEDGRMDLLVGCWSPNELRVLRNQGDGSFGFVGGEASGGASWMLATGDLDGDGHVDVASAGSGSAVGAVLLGDGDGNFEPAVTYPVPGTIISTDLGDLDGDGDLDWVLASFSSDLWDIFLNDGDGTFTFLERIDAPEAGSCALPFDADRDGDLDLALFDELADVILLRENSGDAGLVFFDTFDGADLSAWSLASP
jgi:hypothetical protein